MVRDLGSEGREGPGFLSEAGIDDDKDKCPKDAEPFNGKLVHSASVADTAVVAGKRQATVEFASAEPAVDAWWVAIHKPGAGAKTPGQKQPVWAIANPVLVDGDGDGKVTR